MALKSIVRELMEIKDGIGSKSRRGVEGKHWPNRTRSHIAPDVAPLEPIEQGQWANLPPELLLDIISRVEECESSWPARSAVVFCASVCKSWRDVTKEIVKTPEECGRLTFPISLKQVILMACSVVVVIIVVDYKLICVLFLTLTNSLGPEILQFSASLKEIEQLLFIVSTSVWSHVSHVPLRAYSVICSRLLSLVELRKLRYFGIVNSSTIYVVWEFT